jgi:NADP-dependent 3-hydroxy acid dehydrogenase YdfG
MLNNFLITGISSGLGSILAQELAKLPGAQIIGTMRRERRVNNRFPGDIKIIDRCDLLNDEDNAYLSSVALHTFEQPFCFIHSVGETTEHESFLDFPAVKAKSMFDSHVMTFYNALQHLIPVMKVRGGGNCLAFSCNSTKYNYPLMATFTAAKNAIDSLVRSLANEFSCDKIRFNSLALSTVWSEREVKLKPHGDTAHYLLPEDIAKIIPFLTSDDAHLMSGNSISLFEPSETFFRTGYLERIKKD